jgi:hypothetical protein
MSQRIIGSGVVSDSAIRSSGIQNVELGGKVAYFFLTRIVVFVRMFRPSCQIILCPFIITTRADIPMLEIGEIKGCEFQLAEWHNDKRTIAQGFHG